MAGEVTDLDISAKIVERDGYPNEYFEEQWHLVVICCAQLQQRIVDLEATVLDLQSQIDSFHP